MYPHSLFFVVLLIAKNFAFGAESENLLGDEDFTHFNQSGCPQGYKIVTKIPAEGVEHPTDSQVVSMSDDGDSLELTLPEDRDVWVQSIRPIQLNARSCYLFSVDLKWSELRETGAGFPNLGAGFFIHVYSAVADDHLIAIIQPSAASQEWVTVQIGFDTQAKPLLESVRLVLVSKGIEGRIQLKNTRLQNIERSELPASPQFILPGGDKILGVKLAL